MLQARSLPATLVFNAACYLCASLGALQASESRDMFEHEIRPILVKYCIECHAAHTAKADLRIDALNEQFQGPHSETWHDILNRVSIGEMPPQNAKGLPTEQRRRLVDWIRTNLNQIENQERTGGQTVLRRLTRYEYNNTLRDLTGVALDYSIDLPPDSRSPNGFKNNGSVLGITPMQLEYYLRAARKAMAVAIVTEPAPTVYRHQFETSSPSNSPKLKSPIGNRMKPGGHFFSKMLEYPREGEFVVRVKASASIPKGLGVPRMRLKLGLRSDTVSPTKLLGEVDVLNPESSPEVYEFRGRMEEYPLPGDNPKFPGITITVSNVYDDGRPPEPPIVYPLIKLSRTDSKQVAVRAKELALVLPGPLAAAPETNGESIRLFDKAAVTLQKHIEELRLIDPNSDAVIDLAARLFEANASAKNIKTTLKRVSKQQEVDYQELLNQFETENSNKLKDHQTVLAKFKHLTPLNRKDKKALRALLPPEPPRSTLVLENLEFEGPIFDQWPPKSHRTLLPQMLDEDDNPEAPSERGRQAKERQRARAAIASFMKRAFRRPITEAELTYALEYFEEVRSRSDSFEDGIREAFVMILVSPEFLFHVEASAEPGAVQLSPHEVATRLSYFLWSTTPDERLTHLADSGQLKEPHVLEAQVRRLLDAPQSSEFVDHFTDQWLDLSGIDRVAVNPQYYPKFDNALKTSMREETQAFFAEILRHDISALNLLDSSFLMLNAPMAKHYGFDGPRGGAFERFEIPDDSFRGGLLTHASVLLLNSTGEDSHPIRRGVWVRSRLLDDPPAPPPPDVPDLNPQTEDSSGLTMRQQLEVHRNREACNDCHRGIDPWGIPFENFDAVGKYRTEAVHRTGNKRKQSRIPVSSQSVLPNGKPINDITALKAHLIEGEQRRFARALVSRMLEYSLGRTLVFEDRASIEALTDQFTACDYRLSDLIVAIVQSKLFQSK